MRPSPSDDVNVMNARFLSPQGSHALHTNPPVSQHVTHHVFTCLMVWEITFFFSMLHFCSLF